MIAVSATFVAEPLANPLAFLLAELGMKQTIHFAPYHQLFQQLLTPGSDFGRNRDNTNIALVRLEDFVRENPGSDNACQAVASVANELSVALERFAAGLQGSLLLMVFPPSPNVSTVVATAIEAANAQLLERAGMYDRVEVIAHADVGQAAGAHGYDARRDALAHIPLSDAHFAALALVLARRLHMLRTSAAKVLVLDCDNTLWRGVVGEDGVEGILLTPPYLALQKFAVAQQRKGVLVCLASKNSEADVLAVFAGRTDMHLHLTDVVSHRINWQPKSANLRALAIELNLGLDAFVFMDDNPLECAQMRAELPQVVTLQVPPEAEITDWLDRLWVFDKRNTTEEDSRRTQMYRENAARRHLEASTGNIDQFLAALNVDVDIQPPQDDEWQRLEQLTQRTNQFNFTTRRRSVAELKAVQALGAQVWRVRVRDRFGDYGLVGLLVAQPQDQALVVDTFLVSCRVLGRGVEHAMLCHLGAQARSRNLLALVLPWTRSSRNEPARAFLDSVAQSWGETTADGIRYCMPTAQAQAVRHRPGHDPEAVTAARMADERKGAAGTVGSAGMAESRSERYNRLACVLVSGDAVLEALRVLRLRPRTIHAPATPPTTPAEIQLRQLWEDLLGIEGLGVDDDYFALGGTSVQSVQLFSEAERLFQVRLPLTTLLTAPTVRTLARLLEPGGNPSAGIVPLRPGHGENFFLVHDGLGETLLYLHLARRLPSHLSVFGIEPRRLPGIPLAHTGMEEMAAWYVAQIQSIQPHGPYRLGGMCAGGVIAWAMAAHLRSRGEVVEIVTVMDGATPQAPHKTGRVAAHRFTRLRALLQTGVAQGAARPSAAALAVAVLKKATNALRYECGAWLMKRSVQLRFKVLQLVLRQQQPWPRWLAPLSVAQIYSELVARYQPPGLPDVPVLLVRASQGMDADTPYKEIYRDDDLGWRKVAGQVTLADVAGGHASMLQETHVDSLAGALLAHLPGWARFPVRRAA